MRGGRPHICFVAPNAYPVLAGDENAQSIGGAEVQQVIIARGLVARGYRVSMICLDFGQSELVEIEGIRVFRAFRRGAGLPLIRFVWPRISSLWSCMKRADADIYYQRTAGMLTGLVAAYCRRYRKKSIFAASGNPNFEGNTRRIRFRRDRWLYEYGLKHVDRILAQNDEQIRLCLKNFGRHATLVPNCYDATHELNGPHARDIIWVGTVRELKRPHLFLELASALPQYQFRMIGGAAPGDRGIFRATEARARGIKNLDFMGFIPYSKAEAYFDAAALLVNTSESEGFPNTYLQAWSRGTVTVSLVDAGADTGVPVGRTVSTVADLISLTGKLMGDDAQRQAEGVRCRAYFEAHHTPARILDLYERIFSELMAV